MLLYSINYYRADGTVLAADSANNVTWRDSYISVGKGLYTCSVCTNGPRDIDWYDPHGHTISADRLPWKPEMQLGARARRILDDLDNGALSAAEALGKIKGAVQKHEAQS